MTSGLPSLADAVTRLGRGAASWALPGELDVGHGHWIALTAATQFDFNLAYCCALCDDDMIRDYLGRLIRHRRPGLLATTSDLGEPRAIGEFGWKRVLTAPVMAMRLTDIDGGNNAAPMSDDRGTPAHELAPEQFPLARDLIARTFDLSPDVAAIALRADVLGVDRHIWGAVDGDRLLACGISVIDGDAVTLWSIATDRSARRQGQSTKVLWAALGHARANGCTFAVLSSTPMAVTVYRAVGFMTLDELAYWSNPRWLLADS